MSFEIKEGFDEFLEFAELKPDKSSLVNTFHQVLLGLTGFN